MQNGDFSNGTSNWYGGMVTVTMNGDGSIRVTSRENNNGNFDIRQNLIIPEGHKYYYKVIVKPSSDTIINPLINNNNTISFSLTANTVSICQYVGTASSNQNYIRAIYVTTLGDRTNGAYIDVYYVNIMDLTLMFGAGNEPSSVEAFERLFPQSYYANWH